MRKVDVPVKVKGPGLSHRILLTFAEILTDCPGIPVKFRLNSMSFMGETGGRPGPFRPCRRGRSSDQMNTPARTLAGLGQPESGVGRAFYYPFLSLLGSAQL